MIQLKDIRHEECGAHFLNTDLHIHTFGGSSDVKDSGMTPQAIIDVALEQGLSVIAITDHNSNRNIRTALDCARQHVERLLVLPGVEVTTAHGHLLVYFAPDKTDDLARFLDRLNLKGAMGGENTHTSMSMADAIALAHSLGGLSIAAHIDRQKTGFEMLASGFPNWKRDIINSVGLYGLECDSPESLYWYSEEEENCSAGAERHKLFDARAFIPGLEQRHQLAHIQGSDSHDLSRFRNNSLGHCRSRIKLTELSFSAVRTALIDSNARVRADISVPQTIPHIYGMALEGGFLNGEIIRFSKNLNCFIGGRGTGKSTAIRALAYCFGINEEFSEYDNCPDSVVAYCEDVNGVLYRYERSRGGDIIVKAKEDGTISEVPQDAFRIEYFGQGELAEVAKDPFNNPTLLQEFLDRHITLNDLVEREEAIVNHLRQNAAQLVPLENSFIYLNQKRQALDDIEKKLVIAEEGKLQDIVDIQNRIATEKAIRESILEIVDAYGAGLSMANFERNYETLIEAAGECTEDETSKQLLEAIHGVLDSTNIALRQKAQEINEYLNQSSEALAHYSKELKLNHAQMDIQLAPRLAELKSKGLAGNLAELERLVERKTALIKEIANIEQRHNDLVQCRSTRTKLLTDLSNVRGEKTARRKAQLKTINRNLGTTIKDFTVFVQYETSGVIDEFSEFLHSKMTGSYIQDPTIKQLCARISPCDLTEQVLARNSTKIAAITGISTDWATEIISRLCYWETILALQILAKPPKPIITVRTKSKPFKEIPVIQLSDGQRHTVLLTIAMLAESNVPLIIDQPEDDLDNAFIFTSIVKTLRAIKESRQVILVTHNANIAVLGDSELLLPMHRQDECGRVIERGSIDRAATKLQVQNILEGGEAAFLRRKEIYGY